MGSIKLWKKIFKCHNPYQSFFEWIKGEYTCPGCGTKQSSNMVMCDCTCFSIWSNKLQEKRLGCIKCDKTELVWSLE